jgi:hypothetical protein
MYKQSFYSLSQSIISTLGDYISLKYFPMPMASHSSSVGLNPNHSFTSRYILRFLSGLDFPFTPQ